MLKKLYSIDPYLKGLKGYDKIQDIFAISESNHRSVNKGEIISAMNYIERNNVNITDKQRTVIANFMESFVRPITEEKKVSKGSKNGLIFS